MQSCSLICQNAQVELLLLQKEPFNQARPSLFNLALVHECLLQHWHLSESLQRALIRKKFRCYAAQVFYIVTIISLKISDDRISKARVHVSREHEQQRATSSLCMLPFCYCSSLYPTHTYKRTCTSSFHRHNTHASLLPEP